MKGAIIVAAGMSSRMGEFKPMMPVGSITMIERIIHTMEAAGVDYIVVITGNNAEQLENKLRHMGIIFLRNEDYAHTDMFESAKIGLEHLKDKCEKIIFTPADIPLFTVETVRVLLQSDAMVAVPVFQGRNGHPILLNYKVLDNILSYQGQGGLRKAIKNCGYDKTLIKVDDKGVLMDADTKEDYEETLKSHTNQLFRAQIKIRLAKETPFFESSSANLMKQIQYTGSVRYACQNLNLSYSKSWNMIKNMEKELGFKVVNRQQGGIGGGYTTLTEKGSKLLERYECFEKEINEIVDEKFREYFMEDILEKT